MTNEVKNVPELRFPEFNEDWNERTISDSIKILKSGLSRELSTTDIGLPVIRANNLQNYNLALDDIKYWFKEDPKGAKTENYYLEKNDILVNFINSEAKMGTSCIIKSDFKRDTIYTTNILRYVTKEAYDSYFHYIYTQTYNYKKWIKIITKPAVNQASFTTVDFKKIPYYIPEFKEQQKIGSFFSKLDQQIELEEQKLEKLEEQKKGYMQQIFSQKLRFKDDNGNYYPEWKEKNLGDISELITKGTTPKNKVNDGSINFIKVENISPINGFITNTTKITEEEHSTYLKRSQLKENDILFSIAGTLGRVSVVKREILPANTNQALAIIRLNAMNLEYIKTYLTGRAIKRFIANNPTVGAQPNMSLTQIRDLIIAIPNLTEQEKIGSFFKKIDNSIKKQSDKVELLKERKKGFLQKMFV